MLYVELDTGHQVGSRHTYRFTPRRQRHVEGNPKGRVFIRTRPLWVAWYSRRPAGFEYTFQHNQTGTHRSIAFGRLWIGVGFGTPTP